MLWILVVTILVNKFPPSVAFSFLHTQFNWTVRKDALVLFTHGAKRAQANIPVIAETRSKFRVFRATSQIGIGFQQGRVSTTNPFIVRPTPATIPESLGGGTTLPYDNILCIVCF